MSRTNFINRTGFHVAGNNSLTDERDDKRGYLLYSRSGIKYCPPGKKKLEKVINGTEFHQNKNTPIITEFGTYASDQVTDVNRKSICNIQTKKENRELEINVAPILSYISVTTFPDGKIQLKMIREDIGFPYGIKRVCARKLQLYVFNAHSGQTYCFPTLPIIDGVIQKKEETGQGKRMSIGFEMDSEITRSIPEQVVNFIAEEILKVKEAQFGFRPTVYCSDFAPIELLNSINSNPLCNTAVFLRTHFKNTSSFRHYFHNQNFNQVDTVFQIFGLKKTKSLQALFLNNPKCFLDYVLLERTKLFTQHDNLLKLSRTNSPVQNFLTTERLGGIRRGRPIYEEITSFNRHAYQSYSWYANRLFQMYPETIVANRLIKSQTSFAKDAILQLSDLHERIETDNLTCSYRSKINPFNSKKEAKQFIHKMLQKNLGKHEHDVISSVFGKIAVVNRKLFYTKLEQKWKETIGEFTFCLPKATYELRDIGTEMTICVGSYGYSAFRKNITIVVVKNQNKESVACLELRHNKLLQAKANHNHLIDLDSPLGQALYTWMETHQIETSTYDFVGPNVSHNQKAEMKFRAAIDTLRKNPAYQNEMNKIAPNKKGTDGFVEPFVDEDDERHLAVI